MRHLYRRLYALLVRSVLRIGYAWYRMTQRRQRDSITWVVGVQEIASVVRHLADAIPGSYSVSLFPHPFYDHRYDEEWRGRGKASFWERAVRRPLRLARLANRARGFVYVGRQGFLGVANRAAEFAFLSAHGRKICCYFTGGDIRSPRLLEELERTTGVPNLGSRLRRVNPEQMTDEFDRLQRGTARDADCYADVIFTARVDQLGYLTRPTEPFLYFLPDDVFLDAPKTLHQPPVVLHAPSSPGFKGTDMVRAAVELLHGEGREFEYVELSGVGHDQVREQLRRADIVLNQFFAFMPGVFGIEAMASSCAVLMSADSSIETDLPPGAEKAWYLTRSDEIADHLRDLLDHPEKAAEFGAAGREWAWQHASVHASGDRLRGILDRVLAGTYTGPEGWTGSIAG